MLHQQLCQQQRIRQRAQPQQHIYQQPQLRRQRLTPLQPGAHVSKTHQFPPACVPCLPLTGGFSSCFWAFS